MSGWSRADNYVEYSNNDPYPAQNNITVYGPLPADRVPGPSRSPSLPHAHMKSLRLFRKYCRMMPFIIHHNGYRKYTSVEQAKL